MTVELERSMRHLRREASRALAILIGPSVIADASSQVYIEIHVFLDAPRACLFAHCDGDDLLADAPKRQRHPRADTYAELAEIIAATINQTFAEVDSAQAVAYCQ
jgi:hypothetical protein